MPLGTSSETRLTKADLYDLEATVLAEVSDELVERVADGVLGLDDLLADHFVRELHGKLYSAIWMWGGRFRTRELNLGVAPEQIATELRSSLDRGQHRRGTPNWLTVSAGDLLTIYARVMALELESVLFRSPDPERSASFWGAMTDRPWVIDSRGAFVAGTATQAGLRFEVGPLHAKDDERLHLHLSQGKRNQREWIDTCIADGARLLGSGNIPAGSYARMADPVGEEYCVIEDDNRYLEGCGPLGEVTCEGTHAVGLFWSQVFRWPIVWDQNQELAIQSPRGGTKLAWSGIAPTQDQMNSGQRFVFLVGSKEYDEEISRLVSLGATVGATDPTGTSTLVDPDGVEFLVVL